MIIADVLAYKGHKIETVFPHDRLGQIAQIFDQRNISSVVVVSPGGMPLGIVTDRVLIKAIAKSGLAGLSMPVSDVMTTPVPTCSPEETIQKALLVMTDLRVRHLLVKSGSRMVGLISIGDLVKYRLRDSDLESRVLRELAYGRLAEASLETHVPG